MYRHLTKYLVLSLVCAGLIFPRAAEAKKEGDYGSKRYAKVMITGVYFSGNMRSGKGPDEAVRIYNASAFPAKLGGYYISNLYGLMNAKKAASASQRCTFPADFVLEAGKSAWIAKNGAAFKKVFGYLPDMEAEESVSAVPNCDMNNPWPNLGDLQGVVSLHNPKHKPIDVVPYTTKDVDDLPLKNIPSNQWRGGSVSLKEMNIYGWKGQVLRRDTDLKGRPVFDTNTSADWNASSSSAVLGVDPYHRVEFPGQSLFAFPPIYEKNVRIKATSAPDNNFAGLTSAMDSATDEIKISIYRPSGDFIIDHLVKALERGVKVTMLIEGQTVGGLGDDVRYEADRLHKAGATVYFIGQPADKDLKRRYRFVHTKYMVVDKKLVVVGTENWGNSGHPINPSTGNRGWEVHVESPKLAAQFLEVFKDDVDPLNHKDIIGINDDLSDSYGLPYKGSFVLNRSVPTGQYKRVREPVEVTGPARLEIVLSPDNCLDEESSLLKLMNSAKKELYVLENSIPLWWGKGKNGSMATTPNLPLTAVVQAARRGVRTRVLIDGTFYNNERSDPRDNDDTVNYLNKLAISENLDLEAKVINLETTNVGKIHAKGIIADRERVHISSINWTENSFKGNREAGVVIDQPQIASYYADIFDDDWRHSREHGVEVAVESAALFATPDNNSAPVVSLAKGSRLDVIKNFKKGFTRWYQVRYEKQLLYIPSKQCSMPIVLPGESLNFIGREVMLEGHVVMVNTDSKGHTFRLTSDPKRAPAFFIHEKDVSNFTKMKIDPVTTYTDKTVRITGKLYWRKGAGPEIMVDEPGKVQILKDVDLLPADAPQSDDGDEPKGKDE